MHLHWLIKLKNLPYLEKFFWWNFGCGMGIETKIIYITPGGETPKKKDGGAEK